MLFARPQIETLAQILIEAARIEVMPRFRALAEGAIRTKTSATDVVTDADEAAERRISADLLRAFPGAVIIGEEATAADPGLLSGLRDADLAFVVDPIDGTLNYASGLPLFAVMGAALARGEVVAGVIYDPVCRESFMALRGEGAWVTPEDGGTRDLRVAAPAPLADMAGMVSWRYLAEPLRTSVPARFPKFAAVSTLRCCGQEYRLAAAGTVHFLMYGKMMPWDHCAGVLMHREAGGHAALFDGSPYDPAGNSTGIICAPDRESWSALREALVGG